MSKEGGGSRLGDDEVVQRRDGRDIGRILSAKMTCSSSASSMKDSPTKSESTLNEASTSFAEFLFDFRLIFRVVILPVVYGYVPLLLSCIS